MRDQECSDSVENFHAEQKTEGLRCHNLFLWILLTCYHETLCSSYLKFVQLAEIGWRKDTCIFLGQVFTGQGKNSGFQRQSTLLGSLAYGPTVVLLKLACAGTVSWSHSIGKGCDEQKRDCRKHRESAEPSGLINRTWSVNNKPKKDNQKGLLRMKGSSAFLKGVERLSKLCESKLISVKYDCCKRKRYQSSCNCHAKYVK